MSEEILQGGVTRSKARGLVRGLRALGDAEAPAALRGWVLTELDLADAYFPLESPLGQVFVAYNARGIASILRVESAEDFAARFHALTKRAAYPARETPKRLRETIERQLHGERQKSLRFDLRGLSEFEQAVLLKAFEIPHGEVRPYAWVAREIGRPKAVRAVGTALANNPVPLVIPCHRVVRSDGDLGQYGMGGPAAKRTVLAAEGVDAKELEELAHAGIRYIGSDTTHVFCFPTCRHGRRVLPQHVIQFRSEAAAYAAGYRPCKVCRPALQA
jgi:O-6-methylguanine DNA methyltransferase